MGPLVREYESSRDPAPGGASRVDTLKGRPGERDIMTDDDAEPEAEPEAGAEIWERETAPQSAFTTGQVGVGFLVLALGLAVSFGLPLLLG